MSGQPLAYTLERAVAECGGVLTLNYLTEAVRRGEVAHVRLGRNVGITPEQLKKFVAAHVVEANPAAGESTPPPTAVIDIPSISPRSRAHHTRKAAR